MNQNEVVRKLNSVGRGAFVENYSLFKSYAEDKISRQQCIDTLVADGTSNEAGASIRVSNASLIFQAGKEYDALTLVTASTRVPSAVIRAARKLLAERS